MKNALPGFLLGLTLLTSACTKESALTASPTPAPGTVTYELNGRATAGKAVAVTQAIRAPGLNTDLLTIGIESFPAGPQAEYVQVVFSKAPGAPESSYTPSSIHADAGAATGYFDTPRVITLAKTSGGGWSGTFSGTSVDSQGRPRNAITKGVFTDIRP